MAARGYVVPGSCGGDFVEYKALHFEPVSCALGMGLGSTASRSTGVATCSGMDKDGRDRLEPSAL